MIAFTAASAAAIARTAAVAAALRPSGKAASPATAAAGADVDAPPRVPDEAAAPVPVLHIATPLIKSEFLSARVNGCRSRSPGSSDGGSGGAGGGGGDGGDGGDGGGSTATTVLLKLDNLQPSGSFKIRGIGAFCAEAARDFATSLRAVGADSAEDATGGGGAESPRSGGAGDADAGAGGGRRLRGLTLVTSSSANAGMAVVHAAAQLGASSLVVLCERERSNILLPKFRRLGARILFVQGTWNDADSVARGLCSRSSNGSGGGGEAGGGGGSGSGPPTRKVYVPMFDHPTIFDGHATLVAELQRDFKAAAAAAAARDGTHGDPGGDTRPDAVVVAVGGGGLLSGVARGLIAAGWHRAVRVFAAQTERGLTMVTSLEAYGKAATAAAGGGGGNCGGGDSTLMPKPEALQAVPAPVVDADGHALGNRAVCDTALQLWYNFGLWGNPIEPIVVPDVDTLQMCARFADEHHVNVEPLCAVGLAAVYTRPELFAQFRTVVVVVCGGNMCSTELVLKWGRESGFLRTQ